jgi:hypothetical protein
MTHVMDALERATDALRKSDAAMTWEVIPVELFAGIPSEVRSCWVFCLRGSQDTGAERHPNSHQRSLSLRGSGDVMVRLEGGWQRASLVSDPTAPRGARWVSIPQNAWHRWVVGESDWSVLSFHTTVADQLVEERPSSLDVDDPSTERRRYQGPA